MTTNIIPHENTERIERFHSLQSGQYWRSIADIEDQGIHAGMVLLIQSLRYADDALHTVILRTHPSVYGLNQSLKLKDKNGGEYERRVNFYTHEFLLKDFLLGFEYEPDHQQIRASEVKKIHEQIQALQSELISAQTDPSILNTVIQAELAEEQSGSEGASASNDDLALSLPSNLAGSQSASFGLITSNSLVNVINTELTTKKINQLRKIADLEHKIATIKSEWITNKTSAISKTLNRLTPFFQEQAAAALAQTQDVREYVNQLLSGIESLDLYVGKDVHVNHLNQGVSAADNEPLTIVQRKLMIDEELAVWADVDSKFDFNKQNVFFDLLCKNASLRDQIFPTQRCILVMATSRREIDYGDKHSNQINKGKNAEVFLMARDGENIYRISSPIESHLGTKNLFPSKNDHEKLFRGVDGSTIKFEDLSYTYRLDDHKRFALHYKRFLILLCGLDHRLKLFGDFYDQKTSLSFLSLEFQEKYYRFLHDEDGSGLLPKESRMDVKDWIKEKNAHLRSGSRVLCKWDAMLTPDSAPGAFIQDTRYYPKDGQRYHPKEQMSVAIATRKGDSLYVEVEVSGRTAQGAQRDFMCKVDLTQYIRSGGQLAYLCLDAVEPEEMDWYIHNRDTRIYHLMYIRFFKLALKFIQQEREFEADTRNRMLSALSDGCIATGAKAKQIVQKAIMAWRAANRGKSIPVFTTTSNPNGWTTLLDQMYLLAKDKNQVELVADYVHSLGYKPLRLVITGKAKLMVYAAPTMQECDNRITEHVWVHKITLAQGKTKLLEKSRVWELLPRAAASETTIHEWDEAKMWVFEQGQPFNSYEEKQAAFNRVLGFTGASARFSGAISDGELEGHLLQWSQARERECDSKNLVQNMSMILPFGIIYDKQYKGLSYLCVKAQHAHVLLHSLATSEEAKEFVVDTFTSIFNKKNKAKEIFESNLHSYGQWSLVTTAIDFINGDDVYFNTDRRGAYEIKGKDEFSETLNPWLNKILTDKDKLVWIPDADKKTEDLPIDLDGIFNISMPDDFEPTIVYHTQVTPRHNGGALEYLEWFDLCPAAIKTTETIDYGQMDIGSASRKKCNFYTKKDAEKFVQESIKGKTADLSSKWPDAPQPIDGAIRWIVKAPKPFVGTGRTYK